MNTEYDVILDAQGTLSILQYPLLEEPPFITEIKTKAEGKYINGKGVYKKKDMTFIGTTPNTICDYYIVHIGKKSMQGEKVSEIVQMQPMLPETEEMQKKTEKKTSVRVFSPIESREELENRKKNPNYVIEKLSNEPWAVYEVRNRDNKRIYLNEAPLPPFKYYKPDHPGSIDEIKAAIYNARVSNIGVIMQMFPSAPANDIKIAFEELTIPFLGRRVLKHKYYNDLANIYSFLLGRMESTNGVLSLTFEESTDPEESFFYVLEQITRKVGPNYILKGYPEK